MIVFLSGESQILFKIQGVSDFVDCGIKFWLLVPYSCNLFFEVSDFSVKLMFIDLIGLLEFFELFDSIFEVGKVLNFDNTVQFFVIDVSDLSFRVDKFFKGWDKRFFVDGVWVVYLFVDGANSVKVLNAVWQPFEIGLILIPWRGNAVVEALRVSAVLS